ncbi:MAG: ArsA-related P-loop ATPase [Bdellovibrionota bacterium]
MVKKAHLITGKGGTGKSLFSVVLAHYFSSETQSVLLCELSEHSFYKDYLNLPEISYKPLALKPHLDISQWSPEDCLKEYSLHLLKIESLYRLFFENAISKSLIQVAPGLHELALLGKMTSSPRKQGPPMPYDQIVIDSYSTGHFLSLIRAPAAMSEAIPFGPMGEQSKSIDAWLRNPDFTQVHILTLPEELPISESIELFQQLKKEFNIKAKVYLNKISGLTSDDLTELTQEAQDSLQNILASEAKSRLQLKKAGIDFIELPLVASLQSETLINVLTEHLKVSL